MDFRGIFEDPKVPCMPAVNQSWAIGLLTLKSCIGFVPESIAASPPKMHFAYPGPLPLANATVKQRRGVETYVFNRQALAERQSYASSDINTEQRTVYATTDYWRKWWDCTLPRDLAGRSVVCFHGWEVRIHANPKDADNEPCDRELVKLILWEVYENNGRADLVALEEHHRGEQPIRDRERWERDECLTQIFPDGTFVGRSLPRREQGLSGTDWKERMPFFRHLAELEQYWPDIPGGTPKPKVYTGMTREMERSRTRYLEWEKTVINFYVRSFFFVYYRAPIVPHVLPAGGR